MPHSSFRLPGAAISSTLAACALYSSAMETNYPGGWRTAAISVKVRRICGPELVGGTPPLRRHFKPTLLALAGV
jgi:hypothetical protein